jgi:putative ABC transport system permease protein
VLGIRPLRGRVFTGADGPGSATAVVNEQFAALYLPNQNPLGHRIRLGARGSLQPSEWLTIVGVVPNVRHEDNDPREVEDAVYLSSDANPLSLASLIVRSRLDMATMVGALREQVRALDPDLPVFAVTTLDEAFAGTFRTVELIGSLFGVFAAAALMLATIGLYGVTAYSVSQRTQEIGVRIALGARNAQVWWTVTRRIVIQLAFGLALGLIGSAAVGRLLEGFLWGVGERDPLTLLAVTTLLIAVACAASALPARRAMRVNAVEALRAE